jgi:hypothetical protein
MDSDIPTIVLPVLGIAIFIVLPTLQYYMGRFVKNISPKFHAVIFSILMGFLIFCIIDVIIIVSSKKQADFVPYGMLSIIVGLICLIILLISNSYKKFGATNETEILLSKITPYEIHISNVKDFLETWKKELEKQIKKKKLEKLMTDVEEKYRSEISQFTFHAPSIKQVYWDLSIQRVKIEGFYVGESTLSRLNSNPTEEDKLNRKLLNEKTKLLISELDNSLSKREYLTSWCNLCPKR